MRFTKTLHFLLLVLLLLHLLLLLLLLPLPPLPLLLLSELTFPCQTKSWLEKGGLRGDLQPRTDRPERRKKGRKNKICVSSHLFLTAPTKINEDLWGLSRREEAEGDVTTSFSTTFVISTKRRKTKANTHIHIKLGQAEIMRNAPLALNAVKSPFPTMENHHILTCYTEYPRITVKRF